MKEYAGIYTKSPHDYFKYMGLFAKYIESILRSGKVTIARINGIAVGGGNETQLACDLAVMADDTYLGQVGTSVGSVACGGATQWLSITVGDRRAREMLFLNPRIPAAKALEWGLVNRVVPRAKLDEEVATLVKQLLEKFPECTRYTKAAGELLEGSVVARHGGARARLAVDALHHARAVRGNAGVRREAEGRLHGPSRRRPRAREAANSSGVRTTRRAASAARRASRSSSASAAVAAPR